MSDEQITWGEWARVLKQMEQDQQRRSQQEAHEAMRMVMDAGSATGYPVIVGIDSAATADKTTSWVMGTYTLEPAPAGYEDRGGKPNDAKSPTNTVDLAVNGTVTAGPSHRNGYRSLMMALDRLHASWQSNGRPHHYERPEGE